MQFSNLSRREFVELAGLGSTSAVLAAYSRPTTPAQPVAGSPAPAQPAAPGAADTRFVTRIQVEPITTYDVARLNHILTAELADFSDYPVTYPQARFPVTLYRVTYPSSPSRTTGRPSPRAWSPCRTAARPACRSSPTSTARSSARPRPPRIPRSRWRRG